MKVIVGIGNDGAGSRAYTHDGHHLGLGLVGQPFSRFLEWACRSDTKCILGGWRE